MEWFVDFRKTFDMRKSQSQMHEIKPFEIPIKKPKQSEMAH